MKLMSNEHHSSEPNNNFLEKTKNYGEDDDYNFDRDNGDGDKGESHYDHGSDNAGDNDYDDDADSKGGFQSDRYEKPSEDEADSDLPD